MENEKKEYVNINGIDEKCVHERKNSEGKTFYSVGIQVPFEVSKNCFANVTTNQVFPCKGEEASGKVNIGFPKDYVCNVQVCTHYNKEDKSKNTFETKKMSPDELLSAHIDYLKSKAKANEDKAEDKEASEPELS